MTQPLLSSNRVWVLWVAAHFPCLNEFNKKCKKNLFVNRAPVPAQWQEASVDVFRNRSVLCLAAGCTVKQVAIHGRGGGGKLGVGMSTLIRSRHSSQKNRERALLPRASGRGRKSHNCSGQICRKENHCFVDALYNANMTLAKIEHPNHVRE